MSQTVLRKSFCHLRQLLQQRSLNKLSNRDESTKIKTASSTYKVMNVFDRKAKAMQRDRSSRREDYHLCEYIKEEVGWRTADRVFDIKRTFTNAVELGACRGYVSRHFTPDSVAKVTLCDTSSTHLAKAIVGEGVSYETLVMDEEEFNFPDNSLDLVVSSLTLHWVNDLPGCFDRIMKSLKPDGVFLACMFGAETLSELRQSLQLAETERLGGMHVHVSPFARIDDIGGLLNAAGFTLQTVDTDSITVWYPTMFQVMEDLRVLGEQNAATNRPVTLHRDVQFAAAAIYDEMYGKHIEKHNSRGVPATYQIINFVGWKPDPSQPQPKERGSAELSLKDIDKIEELIKDKKITKFGEDAK